MTIEKEADFTYEELDIQSSGDRGGARLDPETAFDEGDDRLRFEKPFELCGRIEDEDGHVAHQLVQLDQTRDLYPDALISSLPSGQTVGVYAVRFYN